MKPIFFCLALLVLGRIDSQAQLLHTGWTSLFNGKDLTGWDTYLAPPNLTGYGQQPDTLKPPIGFNKDPFAVFRVENGVLHVSGQVWGGIISKEEYGNYHIRFQTKWGQKKWPPKQDSPRDAGFLFHGSDPVDHGFKSWIRSAEMQIQEGEFGDYFAVGAGTAEFSLKRGQTTFGDSVNQYNATAPLQRYAGRVYRALNAESAPGEWTISEVVARQADAVFIVNGIVVNRLYNLYRPDLQRQVTRGKLQFQSESAEVYYRAIDIRPIDFRQRQPKLVCYPQGFKLKPGQEQVVTITNQGELVELIAVELLGIQPDSVKLGLPSFPIVLKKGHPLQLTIKNGSHQLHEQAFRLRLETVLGPLTEFEVHFVAL